MHCRSLVSNNSFDDNLLMADCQLLVLMRQSWATLQRRMLITHLLEKEEIVFGKTMDVGSEISVRLRIVRELGHGLMSKVYLAYNYCLSYRKCISGTKRERYRIDCRKVLPIQ